MKKIFVLAFACMFSIAAFAHTPSSEPKTSTAKKAAVSHNAKADQATIVAWLDELYNGKVPIGSVIFEKPWINKHISKSLKRELAKKYDYDGKGYAMWEIGGWNAGEDVATKAKISARGGNLYDVTLTPIDMPDIKGSRTIQMKITMVKGTPVIQSYKWTKDWKYVDSQR